jgi:putative transposase
MKRKRHTEEQIIAILKEQEVGLKTAELCRKHGISEPTYSVGCCQCGNAPA